MEPGSSHQSGDRAARTRPGGRRPRLRALPASRHRTRIGHRTRARCPNLLQRRPRTPRTADRTAESCGFTSTTRTPQRPLQQIWTTHRPSSTIHSPAARGPRPPTSPDPPDPEDRVLAASAQRACSGHRPDHGAGRVCRRTRGARQRPERRSQMSNMSPAASESPAFSLGSSLRPRPFPSPPLRRRQPAHRPLTSRRAPWSGCAMRTGSSPRFP